jgi:hypothetical protein
MLVACSLARVTREYETSDLLIPLIFYAIEQASTAILVVLFRVLSFVEHFQLLEVVLRPMVLVRGEPCFVLCAFALLVILAILVGTCVDIRQICIRIYTAVYIRPRILALVGGTVDRGTSSHVASVLTEIDEMGEGSLVTSSSNE